MLLIGRLDLLQRSVTTSQVTCILNELPDGVRREDTILSYCIPMVRKGKTILPDDRFLPVSVLQGYNCPWTARVRSLKCEGRHVFAVYVSGVHTLECNHAAANRRIPQTISPRMQDWCYDCLRSGLSVDDVMTICHREDYPQRFLIVPPYTPRNPNCAHGRRPI